MDKKVLHIGCSDYPLYHLLDKKETNLHFYLSPFCKELHGVDINGMEEMLKVFHGTYFNSMQQVIDSGHEYDVILAPNIIEHLENPVAVIELIFKIKFKKLFVLVPNFIVSQQSVYEKGIFTERIHPDHYCWYSPYTLWNLLRKHMGQLNTKSEMNFFDNQNMISILVSNE